jgi:hypothetical protein
LNQAAIDLVNQEVSRIARLFDNTNLGSIQAETFMKLDDNTGEFLSPLIDCFVPTNAASVTSGARSDFLYLVPIGMWFARRLPWRMGCVFLFLRLESSATWHVIHLPWISAIP